MSVTTSSASGMARRVNKTRATAGNSGAGDLADVVARAESLLDGLVVAGDPRAMFLAVYRVVLLKVCVMEEAILDPGSPEHLRYRHLDLQMLRNLSVSMWQLYEAALRHALSGQPSQVSRPWQWAFRATHESRNASVAVLAGMLAHICYDLPLALSASMTDGSTLFNAANPRHRRTLRAINQYFVEEMRTHVAQVVRVIPADWQPLSGFGRFRRLFLFQWLCRLAGYRNVIRAGVYLLYLARIEAEWHAVMLSRQQLCVRDLGERVSRRLVRLNRVSGRFGLLLFVVSTLRPCRRTQYLKYRTRQIQAVESAVAPGTACDAAPAMLMAGFRGG